MIKYFILKYVMHIPHRINRKYILSLHFLHGVRKEDTKERTIHKNVSTTDLFSEEKLGHARHIRYLTQRLDLMTLYTTQ